MTAEPAARDAGRLSCTVCDMRLKSLLLTMCGVLSVITPGWSKAPADIAALRESDAKIHHLALDRFRELAQSAGCARVVPDAKEQP